MAIAIPDELLGRVYDHAAQAYPDECCGYFTGPAAGMVVDGLVMCRNAQSDTSQAVEPRRDATTAFAIVDAELLEFAHSFETVRPARVVYHSHPDGGAYFSALDRELAAEAGYPVEHLVIGVRHRAIVEVAQYAWSADAGEFVEIARWQP